MTTKLKCIMLIDDNDDDNFYHERIIRKSNAAETVITERSADAALNRLKNQPDTIPDLIFLDINMPGMNGWEFLQEYSKLDKHLQSRLVIVLLTTSENPDDKRKAENINIDFKTKPLTKEMLADITNTYF